MKHSIKQPTDHQAPIDQHDSHNQQIADDRQHPHSSVGHYDEIRRIEELRRTQQAMVRDQYQTDHQPRPASLPYLRRASHRR